MCSKYNNNNYNKAMLGVRLDKRHIGILDFISGENEHILLYESGYGSSGFISIADNAMYIGVDQIAIALNSTQYVTLGTTIVNKGSGFILVVENK
jgi:hypothetical protein